MSMVRPRSVEFGWTSYFKVNAKSTPITMLDWHNFSSDSDNLSSDSLHKVSITEPGQPPDRLTASGSDTGRAV